MLNTLFGRLFLASVVILGMCFGLIGYVINQLILDNVYASKQEQLRLQNYVLLTSAQLGENGVELPEELREPLFDDEDSGLYGYISSTDTDNSNNTSIKFLWRSYSTNKLDNKVSTEQALVTTLINQPGNYEFEVTADYFIYRYVVLWELTADKPQLIVFTVVEDNSPTLTAVHAVQQNLNRWLAGIAIGLIITLLLILRWGTRPLRQLAENLKHIEAGKSDRLDGKYPVELQGVARNTNQLIESERKQRERYYQTMSDLAHSLKTPLSVIKAELSGLDESDNKTLFATQAQRMDEIIKHQLQRAVIASHHQLTGNVDINQCVERIISALKKVYADKNITFDIGIPNQLRFKGDERDLMEVLGNVLDNACKACESTVKIEADQSASKLTLSIHDDGNGIPVADRAKLIKRGQRADTRHPGQGIGLDIVTDIISTYQAELEVETSPLGGALFQFKFRQQVI